MEKPVLIFDCDGTLIDSYDAIVEKLQRVFMHKNLAFKLNEIRKEVLTESASYFIDKVCKLNNLNEDEILEIYRNTIEKEELIFLMPNAKEMLNFLYKNGFKLFVYTHRGTSVFRLFKRLGIDIYFEDIIDSSKSFPRKPNCDAINFLINKYNLNRSNVFYVGDRQVDLECSKNANIKSIFYKSSGINIDTSNANYVINNLLEIVDLFK